MYGGMDREGLRLALARFGVDYEARTIRVLVKSAGLTTIGGASPVKGRPATYLPTAAWVGACFAMRHPREMARFENVLGPYRDLVVDLSGTPEFRSIPGLVNDPEFAAHMLMITGSEHGLDPLTLVSIVRQDEGLLDLHNQEPGFLYDALTRYKDVYAEWLASEPLVPQFDHEYRSPEELRIWFASRWLEKFSAHFRMVGDGQLEPPERDHDRAGPP